MDPEDRKLELYKLEYSTAAGRYQEIYRSMWTIFSYLTAISAATLAFGADKVDPGALVATSLLPLIFWFWTTYLPLDRYGNRVSVRLGELESRLNDEFKVGLEHFSDLAKCRTEDAPGVWSSWWRSPNRRSWSAVAAQLRRARFRIGVFMLLVHAGFGWGAWAYWSSGEPYFHSAGITASTGVREGAPQ